MFAQVLADFEDRVSEVDLYFQILSALDNDEIVVAKGSGPQILPIGRMPQDGDSMLKGAAYLVIYNLVEAFVRRGFQAVFDAIHADGLNGVELTELLRTQWIMQKNRTIQTFDGSPKVYMEIAIEIVGEIISKKSARLNRDRLPMSGNLDADLIRDVCVRHGVDYKTPPAANGGSVLTIVKKKRNSLAHGDESFSECGRQATAAELIAAKNEVILFIRGILHNLEKFATSKAYKAS
jgi:hypothetical protein